MEHILYVVIYIHTHPGNNSVLCILSGCIPSTVDECKQQQQDGDDNLVGILILKVKH